MSPTLLLYFVEHQPTLLSRGAVPSPGRGLGRDFPKSNEKVGGGGDVTIIKD